jgi:Zn-finger nucleic acid-binding protein
MENEKDRLIESVNFDERANEDSYFAEKEHELIEGLKTEFQKDETNRREAAMASCPKCSGKFKTYRLMGIDIERCDNCEGIWLKKGELAGILRRQARGPLGVFLDRHFSKSEHR